MEDQEFLDDDILGQINWDNLFTELPDGLFADPLLVTTDLSSTEAFSNPSPDSVSSWIGEIENLLMNDDDDKVTEDPNDQYCDDFLADVLADSPEDGYGKVADGSNHKDSNVSDDSGGGSTDEKDEHEEKIVGPEVNNHAEVANDPVSKKRKRQLRNRDAAVRSRERKKMYVKDLEMKSRYLEGECRRLGRLLQCYLAENQALRFSLQKGNAFGASSAKQESAVLLLESLLLGSLLWFLSIMCLFTLPMLPQSTLELVPPGNMEKENPERVAQRGAESKLFIYSLRSLLKSRRCKASRTKMKLRSHVVEFCRDSFSTALPGVLLFGRSSDFVLGC